MTRVDIDDLPDAIENIIKDYHDEAVNAVKKSVDEVANETMSIIKEHVTFGGRGKYVASMALKTTEDTKTSKGRVWYVKKPYYRLAHLLEYGHASRNGGRVKAFPHIKYGEEYAQQALPKRIEEKLNGIS